MGGGCQVGAGYAASPVVLPSKLQQTELDTA